jgi:hypothetical protein
MPPAFISWGIKNSEKPREKTALPRTVITIHPHFFQMPFIEKPPIKLQN